MTNSTSINRENAQALLPLPNPKEEKLANMIALGHKQNEAYIECFDYKGKNASPLVRGLMKRKDFGKRVEALEAQALQRAILESGTSKGYVMHRLREIAERCAGEMKIKKTIVNKDGEEIEAEVRDFLPAQAIKALELLGKEHGMWDNNAGDRTTIVQELETLDYDELAGMAKRMVKRIETKRKYNKRNGLDQLTDDSANSE